MTIKSRQYLLPCFKQGADIFYNTYFLFISGAANKKMEIARPRNISELPDKLLMSGINLPGAF